VPTSDAELARQALAGSQTAYGELVSRYASRAIGIASRLVRDRALAEELAQDAFVKAFTHLQTYDTTRPFSVWFFRILHNVAVDHLRRRRIDAVSLDARLHEGHPDPVADASSPPDVELERRDLAAALDEALSQLRPEFRTAVVLRYQQGLSVEEVAEVLGIPLGTAKTFLHRARKQLAALLSAEGWGPAPAETRSASGPY
jgi:RNA polymerase sigma-70 factor (ECF subfamily)